MKVALGIVVAIFVFISLWLAYGAWHVYAFESNLGSTMRPLTVLYSVGSMLSLAMAFLSGSLIKETR